MGRRHKGRPLDGIFLLDKPQGLSSNAVLQRVKRIYGAAKAGHTGALDPLATGMLPLTFGEATKFSQFLLEADKRYITTAKLGVRTDSSDADGEVVETKAIPAGIDRARVQALLDEHFSGEIEQVPSMFSALKYKGQPLYKLARKGEKVEVKSRRVTIHAIELLDVRDDEIDLDIRCSKGTYIRSIVEDLGLLLGCGAHVQMLRRLESGPYTADMMLTLEQLESYLQGETPDLAPIDALLKPSFTPVAHFAKFTLSDTQCEMLFQGRKIATDLPASDQVRLHLASDDRFVGIAVIDDTGELRSKRLLSTQG
ncbi:MAG: tRNA pseudouridine(55) synthase TruB [Pseudomonadales bacterium]